MRGISRYDHFPPTLLLILAFRRSQKAGELPRAKRNSSTPAAATPKPKKKKQAVDDDTLTIGLSRASDVEEIDKEVRFRFISAEVPNCSEAVQSLSVLSPLDPLQFAEQGCPGPDLVQSCSVSPDVLGPSPWGQKDPLGRSWS